MRFPLKRAHKAAQVALLAITFLAISNANAANDWVNFATVSMTNATTPKLTANYACYTDGKDILCDTGVGPIYVGTGGMINTGGMTVAGSVSASAVSATYISGTVIQVNASTMPCSAGLNGSIRYSASNNSLEVCIGTSWSALSSNTTPGNVAGGGSATAVAIWSGPNSLTYESATTSGLYWDHPNSRLGIGTTTPTEALSIVSTTGGPASFSLNRPDGYGFVFENYSNGRRLDIGYKTTNRAEGAWYPGSPAISIPFAGNVGVNTGSPTATLQVSGTFTVSNSTAPSYPSLIVNSNGNVGIGTTASGNKLNVGGLGNTRINIQDISDSVSVDIGANSGESFISANGGKGFGIYVGGAERFFVTPTGSIGIGTSNPNSSLTIVGEAQVGSSGAPCASATNGGAIRYSGGTLYYCNGSNTWASVSGGGAGFTGGGSATAIAFWNGPNSLTYESNTTSGLYWDHTNGRLGIGNNAPAVPLDVSGGTVVGSDIARFLTSGLSSGQFVQMFLGRSTSSGEAATWTYTEGTSGGISSFGLYGNRAILNLNNAGNIGVGTQSPTATLQVNGTFTVSTTGQNSLSSASLAVDTRGVSVSSIVHINGSPFSPIGAGGNAILSGTTAVSTSSAGIITMYAGGEQVMSADSSRFSTNSLFVSNTMFVARQNNSAEGGEIEFAFPENDGTVGNKSTWTTDVYGSASSPIYRLFTKNSAGTGTNVFGASTDGGFGIGSGGANYPTSPPNPGVVLRPNGVVWVGNTAGASGFGFINFYRSGAVLGNISQNGTTAVAYNTGSDRRIKENIKDSREGLKQLMQIPVHSFSFRADPSHTIVNGFIAQDLNKVYPDAVTTNGDNGEVPLKDTKHIWQVDYGRVTPLIVKAVQDLKHLVDGNDAKTEEKIKAANDNIQILSNEVEALQREVNELKHHSK